MRLLGGLLLLAAAHAADPAASIDKATAAKLAALGDRAVKEKQPAAARRIFARAIELDPDQPVARTRLGFRRVGKDWKAAADAVEGADTLEWKAAELLKEMRAEEGRRVAAYIRGGLTEHYVKLLDRLPRSEELHKALGHEWIGKRYVRPELAAAARRFDEQRARWRQLATPATVENDGSVSIPGIGVRPRYRVDGILVSGSIPDAELRDLASTVHAPRAFLREIFGDKVRTMTPPLVVFVPPEDFRRCVEALVPAGDRALELKKSTHLARDMAIFRTNNAEQGRDCHAHVVGLHTAAEGSMPRADQPDWQAYAWFREGAGYFAALEVAGTGITYFYSHVESSSKIAASVPPPEKRERADLLPWLQGQILDGTTEPLRNVSGRTLNSLDLLFSLEAWTFLEFLAAYDPEGLRGLPAALAEQTEGSYADRSDAALKACFGKGIAELEPLWRAFVLEIM